MAASERSGIGHGVDVVAIHRVERLLDEFPDRFRSFGFAAGERAHCDRQVAPAQHYAARWAAKEAYIKAVGVEGANPDLSTVAVATDPTPRLELSGDGQELLKRAAEVRGTEVSRTDLAVSMAHDATADIAIGSVFVLF